jgi:hypothetical protein
MKEVDVIPERLTHSIVLDGEERRHIMEIEKLRLALEAEDSIAFLREMQKGRSHSDLDNHIFDPVPKSSRKQR